MILLCMCISCWADICPLGLIYQTFLCKKCEKRKQDTEAAPPGLWRGAWLTRCCCCVASVVSDPVRPHRRQPTRLPRPWDAPGKSTGVGCRCLLQGCRGMHSNRRDGDPPGSWISGQDMKRSSSRRGRGKVGRGSEEGRASSETLWWE